MSDSDWRAVFDQGNLFLRYPVDAAHCHRHLQVTRLVSVLIGGDEKAHCSVKSFAFPLQTSLAETADQGMSRMSYCWHTRHRLTMPSCHYQPPPRLLQLLPLVPPPSVNIQKQKTQIKCYLNSSTLCLFLFTGDALIRKTALRIARRSDAKLVCSWSATPEMQTKSLCIRSSLLLNRPRIWFRDAISAAWRANAISSSSWHSEAADVTEELSQFVPQADDVLEHELVSPSSLVLRSTDCPVRPWSVLSTSGAVAALLLLFFCDSFPATLID